MAETTMVVTPEDLLAGASTVFEVAVPINLLQQPTNSDIAEPLVVQLQPITIGTFNLIMKAAKNDPGLIPLLMIKESMVKPALSLEHVKKMQLGLVNFLIAQIRSISGLTEKKT